jgi:thiamine biosynthesis lipoprotein
MTLSRRALFKLDFDRPSRIDQLVRVYRTAMACRVEVALMPEDSDRLPAARAALDEADRIEQLISIFRESSELSRINREGTAGARNVAPEVFALLQRCRQLSTETDGAFDITSSPLSRCWGFLHRAGRVPEAASLAAALALVGTSKVTLEQASRTVRFARPGMSINFNAVGKGYALDRMTGVLRARGVRHALLSAGGSSVMAMGGRRSGWTVDVRSPMISKARLARIRLRNGALGTSGQGEQFVAAVDSGGARYGHVIDPRSGWPASAVLSCSVVTDNAATADALSTAFLVGGTDLAARFCECHQNTLVLVTPGDGTERPRVFGEYRGAEIE